MATPTATRTALPPPPRETSARAIAPLSHRQSPARPRLPGRLAAFGATLAIASLPALAGDFPPPPGPYPAATARQVEVEPRTNAAPPPAPSSRMLPLAPAGETAAPGSYDADNLFGARPPATPAPRAATPPDPTQATRTATGPRHDREPWPPVYGYGPRGPSQSVPGQAPSGPTAAGYGGFPARPVPAPTYQRPPAHYPRGMPVQHPRPPADAPRQKPVRAAVALGATDAPGPAATPDKPAHVEPTFRPSETLPTD